MAVTLLLCIAAILLGTAVGKPLGWIAAALAVVALILVVLGLVR